MGGIKLPLYSNASPLIKVTTKQAIVNINACLILVTLKISSNENNIPAMKIVKNKFDNLLFTAKYITPLKNKHFIILDNIINIHFGFILEE